MNDRFPAVKEYLLNSVRSPAFENMTDYLIAEVERLRKVEDAARAPIPPSPSMKDYIRWIGSLASVLLANPRPEDV